MPRCSRGPINDRALSPMGPYYSGGPITQGAPSLRGFHHLGGPITQGAPSLRKPHHSITQGPHRFWALALKKLQTIREARESGGPNTHGGSNTQCAPTLCSAIYFFFLSLFLSFFFPFLGARMRLYSSICRSVCLSVCLSVRNHFVFLIFFHTFSTVFI